MRDANSFSALFIADDDMEGIQQKVTKGNTARIGALLSPDGETQRTYAESKGSTSLENIHTGRDRSVVLCLSVTSGGTIVRHSADKELCRAPTPARLS